MCSLLYAKCFLLLTRQSVLNGYPPFKWYYIFNSHRNLSCVQVKLPLYSSSFVWTVLTLQARVKSLHVYNIVQVQMWVNTRDGWEDVTIIDNYWYYWFPYGINVIPSRFIQLSAMYGMGNIVGNTDTSPKRVKNKPCSPFCSKLIFSFNKLSYHLSPTQPSQYNKIHFSYHDKLQQLQSVMQYMHSNDALQCVYTTSSTFLIDMYSTQGTD